MHKLSISFLLLVLTSVISAQVSENFEDGDFTNNPTWIGDQNAFKISTSFQLQLDQDGVEDTSYLSTNNQLIDSLSWEFFIKLSFSPSANNYARVYLVSDQENIKGNLNGYFLQFGEAGSNDAIELFRQDANIVSSICRGTEASLATSFNAKIKVIRRQGGLWTVYSDFGNTGNYIIECQGEDAQYESNAYFGFFCQYTSSNATKFYFDDVEIKYFEEDQELPKVNHVLPIESNMLRVSFTEAMDLETSENPSLYMVNNGVGHPNSADLNSNQNEVLLEFDMDFTMEDVYQLSLGGIHDLSGNILVDTTIEFSRTDLAKFDIVFNEIMADPNPIVLLPDVEYLEIYNRSASPIDLLGWTLEIGTSIKTFHQVVIPSESYMILCKESNIPYLSEYGSCIGFSSFSLTNGGQTLKLLDPTGILIHTISYSDDWYQDPDKDDGGWSLEQINPNNFCSEGENWRASEDNRGGSPAMENSIFNDEVILPEILDLEIADNPLLLLTFNQQMQENDILDKTAYSVIPDIGQPIQLMLYDTSTAVYLSFSEVFEVGVEYTLIINKPMQNCAGQDLNIPMEKPFMLSKIAEKGEVVINEIMADPEPSVSLPPYEYLELFNTSNAPIDLTNWELKIGSSKKILDEIIIYPLSYILLCSEEATNYLNEYGNCYAVSGFSLTNSGNQLVLSNREGALIHQVEYADDWYEDQDKEEGGWSLEAIEPQAFCVEKQNWSESIDIKGGSPGEINSIDGLLDEIEAAKIQRIEILSETSVRVSFTTLMDSNSLSIPEFFVIDEGIGEPFNNFMEGPKFQSVVLSLNNSLQKDKVYTLETLDGLKECSGRDAGGLSSRFAVADQINIGDIVFNEVLFDAAIDDGEYVELVNISNKILEASDLSLSRIKINQYDTSWYTTELGGALLFPNDYVVFSPSASQVLKVYYSETPEKIITNTSFPSLPNEEGILLLHLNSSTDSLIDYMEYHEDMHYNLLNDTKGVSLEKIDLFGGNEEQNWHSAASSVNYGTPAYQNSQYRATASTASFFELIPEVFSPDNDGFDDVLQINYQISEPGYSLNLVIYDAQGRKVKHLVKNELLGTQGSFYWDGENEDHQKAAIGIYILFFEYFDLEGNVRSDKKTSVLGGHL
ncbi:MAG: hypothetical protein GQ527_12925 [Bacteroidales bacterium]|nr:hypothetical protein [Bacteroidales bacterium]